MARATLEARVASPGDAGSNRPPHVVDAPETLGCLQDVHGGRERRLAGAEKGFAP
jgi:hypothetical protein